MGRWQLQEAKNKLSQVVDLARREGPQRITLHGREAAVILSIEEYRRLTRPQGRLSAFFQDSPLRSIELDLVRVLDTGRDIEL